MKAGHETRSAKEPVIRSGAIAANIIWNIAYCGGQVHVGRRSG